jgi:5-methylcytosine-specific restriction endonuclease McrA
MPFKDPQRRREYARSYYSSPDQRAKKRAYDHARYMENREEVRAKNDRALMPHRFVYDGEWACSECGSTEDLIVHHVDFNHGNNDPGNLTCLCRSCHASLHAKASARDAHGRFTTA